MKARYGRNSDTSTFHSPFPVVNMIAFIIIVSIPPKGNRSCNTEGPKHRLPIGYWYRRMKSEQDKNKEKRGRRDKEINSTFKEMTEYVAVHFSVLDFTAL